MSFRRGLSDGEFLKEVSKLKIVGDSKDKINKLQEEFTQMHFKVDALSLAVNTFVTKDEYEVKQNHMNEMIVEIQDSMDTEKRRWDEQLKEMKTEVILTLKQDVVELFGIVNDLKKVLEEKEAENSSLRIEIDHLKNKQNDFESAVSKMKKPDLIPCVLCSKKCNSENSLKRHIIAKHENGPLKA